MIPYPVVFVIEVAHPTAAPGYTESDFLGWIGVAVAVAGTILATPEGIASIWLYVKRRVLALAIRLHLRRREGTIVQLPSITCGPATFGTPRFPRGKLWLPSADANLKIEILHSQVDGMHKEIGDVLAQIDRTRDDHRKKIRESENRGVERLQQVSSELRAERRQSSHVDARGLGPIALGIILTGLPDKLAIVPPVGWVFAAVSIFWVLRASPSWLRDFMEALKNVQE